MSTALQEKPNAEELPVSSAASVLLNGRYLPPPEDKDGKLWVRTSALVQSDPEKLYAMWRTIEDAPIWQEEITSVTPTGPQTSHWVMTHGDTIVEWDSK